MHARFHGSAGVGGCDAGPAAPEVGNTSCTAACHILHILFICIKMQNLVLHLISYYFNLLSLSQAVPGVIVLLDHTVYLIGFQSGGALGEVKKIEIDKSK